MNRLSILISLLTNFLLISADDYIESFNMISDNYNNVVQDVQIIRPINGGTILIPTFDSSCPEELKAPFTAVGYNANGTSRSIPVTIDISTVTSSLTFSVKEQSIYIDQIDAIDQELYYEITSLNSTAPLSRDDGIVKESIDISTLSNGIYVLTVRDSNSSLLGSMRFKK